MSASQNYKEVISNNPELILDESLRVLDDIINNKVCHFSNCEKSYIESYFYYLIVVTHSAIYKSAFNKNDENFTNEKDIFHNICVDDTTSRKTAPNVILSAEIIALSESMRFNLIQKPLDIGRSYKNIKNIEGGKSFNIEASYGNAKNKYFNRIARVLYTISVKTFSSSINGKKIKKKMIDLLYSNANCDLSRFFADVLKKTEDKNLPYENIFKISFYLLRFFGYSNIVSRKRYLTNFYIRLLMLYPVHDASSQGFSVLGGHGSCNDHVFWDFDKSYALRRGLTWSIYPKLSNCIDGKKSNYKALLDSDYILIVLYAQREADMTFRSGLNVNDMKEYKDYIDNLNNFLISNFSNKKIIFKEHPGKINIDILNKACLYDSEEHKDKNAFVICTYPSSFPFEFKEVIITSCIYCYSQNHWKRFSPPSQSHKRFCYAETTSELFNILTNNAVSKTCCTRDFLIGY
jgi:hypothetical protein